MNNVIMYFNPIDSRPTILLETSFPMKNVTTVQLIKYYKSIPSRNHKKGAPKVKHQPIN